MADEGPAGAAFVSCADGGAVAAAKNMCLRWLTARMHSRAELASKLGQRGVGTQVADAALDRLEQVGLIDDESFAEAFVRAKHRDRGLGRAALQQELARKGVDREVAARAVAVIDDDAERQRAEQLVARKLDSAILSGLESARRRLLGMLARRGYSPTVAVAVVNAALDGYLAPADIPLDES